MLLVLSFSKAFGTKKSSSANSQTSASQESNKTYVSRNLFVGPVCRRVCGLLFTPAGCFSIVSSTFDTSLPLFRAGQLNRRLHFAG